MGLHHTVVHQEYDDCSDTPSKEEINDYAKSIGRRDEDCGDSWANVYDINTNQLITKDTYLTKSNNLMDYGNLAITPQQLGKIHYTLSKYLKSSVTNNYQNEMITIEALKGPYNSYVSKKVEISPLSDIELNEGQSLILNTKEVVINRNFSVNKGSYFLINKER